MSNLEQLVKLYLKTGFSNQGISVFLIHKRMCA